ncbi:hypothetical protein K2173_009710 [Erythroxylum novogranatense]|uniref:RRM domain-containing protein n=1 Tax=Erythroxylum novogranatense TaxID=1862640 RepID=A0AAV8U7Y6_9ROSI|nr:hypothetical protein K2173_009710 [Erythroxylum novogranatense]
MAHLNQQYDPYYQLTQIQQPFMPPPPVQLSAESNSINTLFVSGLPDDVKAREIHNLFRRRAGFVSCQLKYTGRGNQVVAFATFSNHQSAIAAMNSLNGIKFDPQTGSILHIELARSNSRKRKAGTGAYVVIDKRPNRGSNEQKVSIDDVESDFDSDAEEPETDNVDCSQDNSVIIKSETTGDPDNSMLTVNEHSEKPMEGGVQPCSTLFIANLGPNCTEDELKQVLSQYPGFNVLKLRAKGGMPVAFADFEETQQATNVRDILQGTFLPSSDRGGMHIEYARSKMRKHKHER